MLKFACHSLVIMASVLSFVSRSFPSIRCICHYINTDVGKQYVMNAILHKNQHLSQNGNVTLYMFLEFGSCLIKVGSNVLQLYCLSHTCRYCEPQYSFPLQSEAVARVVELVLQHHRMAPSTLFVCGTYTLGKSCISRILFHGMWCHIVW